jgi:hypothetical protein
LEEGGAETDEWGDAARDGGLGEGKKEGERRDAHDGVETETDLADVEAVLWAERRCQRRCKEEREWETTNDVAEDQRDGLCKSNGRVSQAESKGKDQKTRDAPTRRYRQPHENLVREKKGEFPKGKEIDLSD